MGPERDGYLFKEDTLEFPSQRYFIKGIVIDQTFTKSIFRVF